MGVTIAFDYTGWIARYPEFSTTVLAPTATMLFNEATIYHRNDGTGPVSSVQAQTVFLWQVVAHLAKLYFGTNTEPVSSIVGRISNASEGSVSVSTENSYPPGTPQWWQQTKYGSAYWAAAAPYRTMRYLRGPRRPVSPWYPYVG